MNDMARIKSEFVWLPALTKQAIYVPNSREWFTLLFKFIETPWHNDEFMFDHAQMNRRTWKLMSQTGEAFFLLAGGAPDKNSRAAENG